MIRNHGIPHACFMAWHQSPSIRDLTSTKHTLHFIVCMSVLMFLILLIANILKNIKDSFITINLGVEAISYIRLTLELPITLIFVGLFNNLSKKLSKLYIFGSLILFYFTFLLSFGFIILPYHELLSFPYLLTMTPNLPHLKWLGVIFSSWHYSLAFVLFDLWPVLAYTYFFWELSNRIVPLDLAGRLYPLYSVVGQANLLLSGSLVFLCTSNLLPTWTFGPCGNSYLYILIFVCLVCLIAVFFIYQYISKQYAGMVSNKSVNQAQKISRWTIFHHPYLRSIFLSTFCYYAGICLIEAVCLHLLKKMFHDPRMVAYVQAIGLMVTGVLTIISAFVASHIISKLGWYKSIWVLPIVLTMTGMVFLILLLTYEGQSIACRQILLWGLGAHIISRVLKYTLYDATKELTYIPFPEVIKSQGKIATDTIATNTGKIGGHVLQVMLFSTCMCTSYDDILIYLLLFLVVLSIVWGFSLKSLRASYNQALSQNA